MTAPTSHAQVVTIALLLEGGDQRAVDTEDVAIRANRIAPGRFTWKKYPDQINLELVRVYLFDAQKPEHGGLVVGSGKTGWSLTPAGLEWARKAAASLAEANLGRRREEGEGGSVDERRWRRERARIVGTSAWTKWIAGDRAGITAREAADVFRIDSYSQGRMLAMKLTRIRSLFADDPDISAFLESMSELVDLKDEG